MRIIVQIIDTITDYVAKAVHWLVAAMVLIISLEVIMRYIFSSPTAWSYETTIMLGAAVYALGWSYAHRRGAHIRVDIFFEKMSTRTKAFVNAIGSLLLFFPLITLLIINAYKWALRAWIVDERMVETFWFPPSAPLRTVVLIGFCLFGLQGIARFISDSYIIVRNKPL